MNKFILIIFLLHLNSIISSQNDERVKIDIYYETLCPYCMDFLSNNSSF